MYHIFHKRSSFGQKSNSLKPLFFVCYVCEKEFASTSLPYHESECIKRWERENASLPPNLRRQPPKKPDRPLTAEEWNEFAYAAAQASLVPCEKCERKFQPDRLPVHMKACLGKKRNSSSSGEPKLRKRTVENSGASKETPLKEYQKQDSDPPPASTKLQECVNPNPTGKEPCYLCGWMISPELLANHEEACLAKWQSHNDKLPLELQKPLPIKPGQEKPPAPTQLAPSPPHRRMAICYLCGRKFGSASIRIHEPQCLKKWKVENEKLPPEQRRPEPQKPKIIYSTDGQVDVEATDEAFWQSHLVQLVPCSKCGRTFNPDRVAVHEKACKGLQHQKH